MALARAARASAASHSAALERAAHASADAAHASADAAHASADAAHASADARNAPAGRRASDERCRFRARAKTPSTDARAEYCGVSKLTRSLGAVYQLRFFETVTGAPVKGEMRALETARRTQERSARGGAPPPK